MATPPVSARARRTRTRTFCIRPSQKISPVAVVARTGLKESSATMGQGYQSENGDTCSRGDSRSWEARACNAVRKRRRLGFQSWRAKLRARGTLRNGRTFRLRGTRRLENARQRLGARTGQTQTFLNPRTSVDAKPCYHGNRCRQFHVVSQTQCRCGQTASTSEVGKLVLRSRQRVSMRGSKTGFHRVVGG